MLKRILILNWRCPKNPLSGGAEKVTLEHAAYWVKKGIDVTWLAGNYSKGKKSELIRGVKIYRYGSPFTIYFLAPFIYWLKYKGNFDLVFDEIHGIPFLSPLWAWKSKKIAYIHEVAQEIWDEMVPFPFNIIGKLYEKIFFKFYKNIQCITASNSTKDDLMKYGINNKNINVIPHGLFIKPLEKPTKKEKELTLIFLGRIVKMKGIEEAIDIFKKINLEFPKSILRIVGNGEEKYIKYLKTKINTLNLQNNIKFYGFVSENEKLQLLRSSHFLLHTSIREGFGLTVIEANSQGTPVLAYYSPGLKDLINEGYNGFFIKRINFSLIKEIIRNKRDYNNIQENCIIYSNKFLWNKIKYELIYSINNIKD